jgi:PAS domain S-box-containing protein
MLLDALTTREHSFLPHGFCYQWDNRLIALHVVSDALIALAYFAIPFGLLYLVRRRPKMPFRRVILCFGIFITACGATHLMEIVTLWFPVYWTSGYVKLLTALVSLPTAFLVARVLPAALDVTNTEEWRIVNHKLFEQSKALEEIESQYKSLVERSNDLLCTHDRKGILLSANEAVLRALGYLPEEMLQKPMRDFVAPEARPRCDEYLAEVQQKGFAKGILPVVAKNGAVRLWEYHSTLKRDRGGMPLVHGFAQDVTDKLRAEKALRLSEEKFSKAFQASPVELAILTLAEGRFLEINDTFEQQTGFARGDVIGRTAVEVGLWVDNNRRARLLDEIRKEGSVRAQEVEMRTRSGEIRVKLYSAQSITVAGERCLLAAWYDVTARKEAERALLLSEQRFAAAFHSSPSIVSITTLEEGRFIDVNDAFLRCSGYTREEVLGRTSIELGLWADWAARGRILNTIAASGNIRDEEMAFRTKSGVVRICSTSVIPLEIEGWKCLLAIGHDVTSRKKAEEALRNSEERFRLMADNIEEIFWLLEPKSLQALYVSPAFETICERSLESVRSNPLSYREILHPEDAPDVLAKLDCLERTGQLNEQFRILCPGNRVKWVEVNGFTARDSAGNVTALVGTAKDITDRKKVEQSLRDSESEYRSLFLDAPCGICRFLTDGTLLIFNRAFREILGYASDDELRSKNLFRDIQQPPDGRREILKLLEAVDFAGGLELHWRRRDEQVIRVRASFRAVRQQAGEIACIETMAEDMTEHYEVQERIGRMQKMEAIALLAEGIAHDFNNILSGILGYAELLLKSTEPEDPKHQRTKHIVNAALQGRGLTARLLAFNRDERLASYPVDVDAEIRQMEDMLRRLIQENVEILFDLCGSGATVLLGTGLLYQIILNLAANAKDAMPDGGTLRVRTGIVDLEDGTPESAGMPRGRYLRLEVQDNGNGMSKDVQERIFEPFYTTKRSGKGTGLGLFTVFCIVRQSSGHIRVQSEPGRGSTFQIYLPVVDSPPRLIPEETLFLPRAERPSFIMVVEDNERVRNALHDQLIELGYSVLCEDSSPGALADFERLGRKLDAVVTDVILPELQGPDLVQQMRQKHPGLKVLFVTGYASEQVLPRDALGPGTDLLHKPFTFEELGFKMQALLNLRAAAGGS